MAGSEDQWKLLCVGRDYHVCRYVWDPSQKLFNHRWMFFREMPQFNGTNSSTEQCAAFAHGALATNRLDIRGLLTISRYMWCYVDVLLVFLRLAIAFEWALFPDLPIGRLTINSLSVDLHEGSSDVVLCII